MPFNYGRNFHPVLAIYYAAIQLITSLFRDHIHSFNIHHPHPIRVKHALIFQLSYTLLRMAMPHDIGLVPIVDDFSLFVDHREECFNDRQVHANIRVVRLQAAQERRHKWWIYALEVWMIRFEAARGGKCNLLVHVFEVRAVRFEAARGRSYKLWSWWRYSLSFSIKAPSD